MPGADLVVSDTSPLLNLSLIERLDLLRSQFDGVTAPSEVWEELTEGDAGVDTIRTLRNEGFLTVVDVERTDLFVEIRHQLDLGETAAISYAVGEDADLLLVDERDGRRVARRHDIEVTGVIGVLLRGANDGKLDLAAELDALQEAGFWIADDLYSSVLSEREN